MSSSRIHRHYNLDRENVVVIDTTNPALQGADMLGDTDLGEEEPELSPEEQVAQIIEAAQQEAEQIILDAQAAGVAEQAALRNAAKSEITVLLEQTREQGYHEGMTEATREGDQIRAQARQVLAEAEAERAAMQEMLEPEMVDLLIGIATKLLGNALILNPSLILALVRKGMQSATISGEVTIYVSSDDYDAVVASKDEITAMTDGSVKLNITKDLSLSPMDCVIETPFGNIDCSLNQQFEALCQNITYLLNG
ncbi:MAG: FliH/SctL family protein [Defluviitaleaceae bacterium]|nr:FliH/SctL family protein [Defluviitaleaceae bacterium]MCL2240435.1 FliH/SctL family protein [Defluviitaleaceae bacterium]